MHLREIVAAPKTQIKVGPWRSGKVPRADFPLAKKAYGLGNSYDWQVISFHALGAEFKVLIMLNEGKQKYEAVLGMMNGNILKVLCSYEFHPSEPGWHCHAACGEVGTIGAGCMRGPWYCAFREHSNAIVVKNSQLMIRSRPNELLLYDIKSKKKGRCYDHER